MANRIVLNNISYHGKGAIQEIVNEVKTNGYQHLFVATDPDLLKFGVTAKVTDILDNAGIAYTVYSKIKPNPTIHNCTAQMIQLCSAFFLKKSRKCVIFSVLSSKNSLLWSVFPAGCLHF